MTGMENVLAAHVETYTSHMAGRSYVGCSCGWDSEAFPNAYVQHVAEALTAAGYRKPRIIEDVGSRDALPDGAVVMSSAGTMACKFDSSRGVMFGMSLPFPWKNLALPLTVLWEPLP